MKKSMLAMGFYQNPFTAQQVLKKLRKAGFRKSASIHNFYDGHYSIDAYTPPFFFVDISSEIINRYKQYVIRDETLVLVEIKQHETKEALRILRNVESGHPISFLLRPDIYSGHYREEEIPKEPLPSEQLLEQATKLAESLKGAKVKKEKQNLLLRRLEESGQLLSDIRQNLLEAEYVEQTVTLSVDWLLDNTHVIRGSIVEIRRNLPKKFYEELPKITEGPMKNFPRIYMIAKDYISHTFNKLTRESLIDYLHAFQTVEKLTIGELWALPLMLRLRLIECIKFLALHVDRRLREGEEASFWGNRLLNIARREPDQLPHFLNVLADDHPHPSAHFAEELLDHLFDEEAILPTIRKWLEERLLANITDIMHLEQKQKSSEQLAISNAIVSLITLSQLSWREIFEEVSPVDAILRKDPEQLYSKMDFLTRDTYRHSIEVIAHRAHLKETEVAQAVLELAHSSQEELTRHVGYYLIDDGRPILEETLKYKPTLLQKSRRWMIFHPTKAYLLGISFLVLALEALVVYLSLKWENTIGMSILFSLLALLPISEVAIQLVNLAIIKFLTPFILPKMDFEKGVPEEYKTLVVVPMMLTDPEAIKENAKRLEIHYLANTDRALCFGLFSDYRDAPQQHMDEDSHLLEIASKEIQALDNLYGPNKFFLFHRNRVWDASEKAWIGWERKRGKLDNLNHFLLGKSLPENILYVGSREALANIRFVITLDSDTQLPKDKAKELIETLAHPLNVPHISTDGKIKRGFSIIQPRVNTSFPSTQRTLFSRIFSDVGEVNPYTQVISDVYQDLVREGTYHGKGIYDVKAFDRMLTGRFPNDHLLSHDLIEGAYARVGFASFIVLFDSFPKNYLEWSMRQHRWMRGDWQIIDWLFPHVPNAENKKVPNTLSGINRWKIFDNLRRALLPISVLVLLLVTWIFSTSTLLWTTLALIVFFFPALTLFFSTSSFQSRNIQRTNHLLINNILRSIINIALLPHQALLSLDALIRVFYRRWISHKHLLEWFTHRRPASTFMHRQFLIVLGLTSLFSTLVMISIILFAAHTTHLAAAFCTLWAISPLLVSILDNRKSQEIYYKLSEKDIYFIRQVARRTFRYFDELVGPQTNWLPPDNYQTALGIEIALRTSPTNIGLWMLAVLSGYDLKYLTADQVIDRLAATCETLKKLEQYEGHFLNWYDIKNLQPLHPRYVSTVDTGNLLASFWTLDQGIFEMFSSPLFPYFTLEGVKDCYLLCCEENPILKSLLLPLKKIIDQCPQDIVGLLMTLQQSLEFVQDLYAKNPDFQKMYWFKKLQDELLEWNGIGGRYFSWVPLLLQLPSSPETDSWKKNILQSPIPSLNDLATGKLLEEAKSFLHLLPEKLKESLSTAQWFAGEKMGQGKQFLNELRKISNNTNMQFLYNKDRKVFSIGYRVEDCQLDTSYYDLLASEARIASFVAIAKGDIPLENWWSLGRPYAIYHGRQVLQSWGGTLFEYLMPLLFNRLYPNSLLGEACQAAVLCQIDYATERGIPWGISEAAFCEIDSRKTYQYRSFGIPQLGFKRGLEDDLVVSPYSSALSLMVNPQKAIQNLQELAKGAENMLSDYGFYESIDFTRQRGPHGERGVIVYAYMAHHQGMSLLSFNNLLNKFILNKRFHLDPRIAGVESLLYEQTSLSPSLAKGYRREIPMSRLAPFSTIPLLGVVDTPHSIVPKVNLLSNGSYSIMTTNSGGGYSRWDELDITRWRSDTTSDHWGSFCYIKDTETGQFWSSTYTPSHIKGKNYRVSFKADKTEIRRRDHRIDTLTEIVVSPEDNVEVRLMTIANISTKIRHLELTSYAELALAPHVTDRSHPSFNKLFIEMEAIPELSSLLAFRRSRSSDEKKIWATHTLVTDHALEKPVQYETDRRKFIGRGSNLQHPAAMNGDLKNSEGTVLDPIFSLRCQLVLQPGQRVQVAFVTGAANSLDDAKKIIQKYSDLAACHRALELAWTQAQLEMRHLRIHQEEAQLFQKLASRVLYPHAQLRPSLDRLRRNTLGQSSLWGFGISGDLPIVVITIADIHEIDLVKQTLNAHIFWRMRGLQTDLVIINEQSSGYDQELGDQLKRIINAHGHQINIGKSGGVFILSSDQIPEEELTLILSVSRVNLIAARGSLRQQLVSPMQSGTYPHRLITNKRIAEEPSKPLPFMELPYFNGYGGFTPDGREYVIYLGPDTHTPAPWCNVLANPQFGTLVSESGLGCTWYGNSQTNRLTPWSNDPVLNPIVDCLYIRDEETGKYWNPTPGPIRETDAYRIRHGQGYSHFEHNSHAIEQNLTITIPMNDNGGDPIRIQHLRLKNSSSRQRHLTVTSYSSWVLGIDKEESQMHVITEWDTESQALFAYNQYHADYSKCIAFTFAMPVVSSYTGCRTEFLGRNNPHYSPAAMKRKKLSRLVGAALDPCSALQVDVELNPGEEKEVFFFMGYAKDKEAARKMIQQCRQPEYPAQAVAQTKNWWDKFLETIQVEVPDAFLNFAMNRWLLYQTLSCRFWGRAGFYQSSGAFGFRDQLQDAMALVYAAPPLAREQILKAASRQFVEGDVQHWWHPPSNVGIRTRISDDLLWLPYVTAHYVRITQDKGILEEIIPFIKGPLLKADEQEAYFLPEISEEKATLLEHCRRAIQKGHTSGVHGLPLMGSGDWNDGMNRVGLEGKGESVWLAWFLIQVMKDFSELIGEGGEGYLQEAKRLAEAVENGAWDGQWYRRAYFDDGTPLGSIENKEGTIDSLAQTWAVLCGAAKPERTQAAMNAVNKQLVHTKDQLILLLTPSFDKTALDPGYIKGYPPGVRENGGQYTHGSLWVPMAFARSGNGDLAADLLRMMHPMMHTQTPDDVHHYRVEPYVLAGDVYALQGHVGMGGWSWYTGSSAWMYRIWLEEVLGFHLEGNRLRIKPVLPSKWEKVRLKYRYKETTYEISIEKAGDVKEDEGEIVLVNDGGTHQVVVKIKH